MAKLSFVVSLPEELDPCTRDRPRFIVDTADPNGCRK